MFNSVPETSLLFIFMENGTFKYVVLFNLPLYLPVFLPPAPTDNSASHFFHLQLRKNHETFAAVGLSWPKTNIKSVFVVCNTSLFTSKTETLKDDKHAAVKRQTKLNLDGNIYNVI